ncbi:MAG: ankyrin repeat domain-containing protein [Alphaproteobacteria bacterium]|nr:MAG: ankyrin repeat domain-containing protein [Alphaproteobacteria bacterium]
MWDDDSDDWNRGRYQSPEARLWHAVRRGDVAEAEKTLAENAEINLKCRHKEETLVYYAICKQDYAMAETLLKAGADVNAPSGFLEFNPFIHACNCGDEKAIDLLVKYKADPNARTHDQETSLHRAAWRGDHNLIRRLVDEFGCDVNAQNYLGQTAMFCAVSSNFPETIKTLMELGADPDIEGSNGFRDLTPRAFAGTIEKREQVADTLDNPALRETGKNRVYEPVTRRPVQVGRPLTLKLKP